MDQIDDLAGVQEPIEVKVFGPDPATLRELAAESGRNRRAGGRRRRCQHSRSPRQSRYCGPSRQRSDWRALASLELDVESQLNAALYGQVASTVPEQDRMTKIRVRYPDRVRYDRENLGRLPISLAMATATPTSPAPGTPAAAGIGFVPLDQLASIRVVRSPNELWRENQQPVLTVTARLDKRDVGSVNRELQSELSALRVPAGLPLGARRELPGAAGDRLQAC